MKHISELTTELSELYDGLKTGTVDVKVAAELNNTAGKIIHAQRVQLEYAELRKEQPDIPFMKTKSAPKAQAKVEA
jgi:adhesin HecA-like repeat protein